MVVEMGSIKFDCIELGIDTTLDQALLRALYHYEHGPFEIRGALINCNDGLVLLDDVPADGARGYHFRTPVSGCPDTRAHYAAVILEQFRFGRFTDLYPLIAARKQCEFTRP